MTDQMPDAVHENAEQAEKSLKESTRSAARDLGEGEDQQQPDEPTTTVD